jgi:hypothetical protein
VKLRLAAALVALAALGIHFGWTRPFRAEASSAADEYRQVRDQRRQAASDRAREARLLQAPARVGVVPGAPGAPAAAATRRLVVGRLASSGVSNAKLRVTRAAGGGRTRVGASVHLTGVGSLDDVARFTGELARPGTGLVLSSVSLVPRAGAVDLSFEALALGTP